MKSALESLNPTRVRLTVEVPFEELKPSLDSAYRKIAGQVTIPGFRKGKVPPRIIDQRFGRSMVLEEAVAEALPEFYGKAVAENDVHVLGRPEVDVTEVEDGQHLKFTAEVDVRPDFDLPDYRGLRVTVRDADVSGADLGEQLEGLRARFAVLKGVDRPAAAGDYVSLDLSATVAGEAVDDLGARGLSYQVGEGSLLDGLDDAVTGLSAGQSQDFSTALVGGDRAGADAQVSVTVNSVKERELPELDDEFAQTASEFDTIAELRDDLRARLERIRKLEQGVQARDHTLSALLAMVHIPLPEGVVQNEVEVREHALSQQLEQAGVTREAYLESEGQSEAEFAGDLDRRTREAVASQFVLDKVVAEERLSVNEQELSAHIVRTASRYGVGPDEFAQQIVQSGEVPVLVSQVARGKALALLLESATVVDESGRPVDLEALREDDPTTQTVEYVGEGDAAESGTADDGPTDDAGVTTDGGATGTTS